MSCSVDVGVSWHQCSGSNAHTITPTEGWNQTSPRDIESVYCTSKLQKRPTLASTIAVGRRAGDGQVCFVRCRSRRDQLEDRSASSRYFSSRPLETTQRRRLPASLSATITPFSGRLSTRPTRPTGVANRAIENAARRSNIDAVDWHSPSWPVIVHFGHDGLFSSLFLSIFFVLSRRRDAAGRVCTYVGRTAVVTSVVVVRRSSAAHLARSSFHFGLFDKSTVAPLCHPSIRPLARDTAASSARCPPPSRRASWARIIYGTTVGQIYRRPISHEGPLWPSMGWRVAAGRAGRCDMTIERRI